MNKLELKHLAPYLPYGLRGAKEIFEPSPENTPTYKLVTLHANEDKEWSWWVDDRKMHICDIKPILKPLTDLTEKDKDYLWFEIVGTDDDCYDRDDLEEMYDNTTSVRFAPQFIFEYLLSKHFDVFGLIDKGLAIDINTLEK